MHYNEVQPSWKRKFDLMCNTVRPNQQKVSYVLLLTIRRGLLLTPVHDWTSMNVAPRYSSVTTPVRPRVCWRVFTRPCLSTTTQISPDNHTLQPRPVQCASTTGKTSAVRVSVWAADVTTRSIEGSVTNNWSWLYDQLMRVTQRLRHRQST